MSNKIETELDAILKKLECFCYEHSLPMFVTVNTGREENDGYVTRITSSDLIKKQDPKIADLVLIMRGFVPVSENRPMDIEYESVDLSDPAGLIDPDEE